jgi:hypothetical protein
MTNSALNVIIFIEIGTHKRSIELGNVISSKQVKNIIFLFVS